MRTPDHSQQELLFAFSIDSLIPADHPLRAIRALCERALRRMEPQFAAMYSHTGRPGIAPERLLRALLLQLLYGFRSERRLMQEMQYNFALRWFVGLAMSEQPWEVSSFTKNRAHLLEHELATAWLKAVVLEAQAAQWIDREHFSVDGTLIEAWASEKSYRPKPGSSRAGAGQRARRQAAEARLV